MAALTPAPDWTAAPPTLEGERWVAAGFGVAATIDQAEVIAAAAARAALLALRGAHLDEAAGPGDPPLFVDTSAQAERDATRLALVDSHDVLTMVMPADGQRFARRLARGDVEAFIQVSVDDIELLPQRRLHQAAAFADPAERVSRLLTLSRAMLLRGMDDHCQAALEVIGRETELAPETLFEVAEMLQLIDRRDDAQAANARALEQLLARPGDAAQLARAEEQQRRLFADITSIEHSLLSLERLTRATRRDHLLTAPMAEVLCEDSQMATVDIVVGGEAGRLAPLWIDADGVRLVNLSNDGRVFGKAVRLSVGLAPTIDSATLLVWLLPEDQGVLATIDSLRDESLPSADAAASDDQRLRLQALLDGLRGASAQSGVGAVVVRLHR